MPGQIRSSSSLDGSSHPRQLLTNILLQQRNKHHNNYQVDRSSVASSSSLTSRTNSHQSHRVKKVKPPADMFIVKALEKILSDRDIKKSYNSQLKKACEDAMSKSRITLFLKN
jgi:hypothetical protein